MTLLFFPLNASLPIPPAIEECKCIISGFISLSIFLNRFITFISLNIFFKFFFSKSLTSIKCTLGSK